MFNIPVFPKLNITISDDLELNGIPFSQLT